MNLSEFLDEFQLEAGEKLDIIASQLLRLERDSGNPQPLREMFLAAHTIKGGAAMLRLTDVESLAHAIEDLLSSFRDQQRVLDGPTADLLFQSIDHLRTLVASASSESVGLEPDPRIASFSAQLRANADGSVDTSFASAGSEITTLRGGLYINAMVEQSDGAVVLAGDRLDFGAGRSEIPGLPRSRSVDPTTSF